MKNKLQETEELGEKYEGLPDEVTLDYFRRLRGVNIIEEDLSAGNIILINNLVQYQPTASNTNKDILLKYNGHYSSLPLIKGQSYLFDSAGNLHQDLNQDQSFKEVKDEITGKFPGIQSLNPFGLNYQNNSNACGIWSANILNQVQEFKKTGKESEIVKTYTGSDGKNYQILNPEILLKAAAQVSKDLTPEREKPEIKILQQGQKAEEGYTPLKIGNTTFAIDTTYRPDRCIDIEAIALSIPREELSQEVNQDFIKKQEKIAIKTFLSTTDTIEQKRRERLEQVCKKRFTQTELMNIKLPRSQPSNPQTTLEQKPSPPKTTSNPVLKCFNFDVAKQKLEKQRIMQPQSTPPKPQPKLPPH